jgi:predicted GNAT superfamily acetyltransferase
MNKDIEIRECATVDELSACVQLQRDVFALPEIEISPVRHFIVTRNAGGWTLGAFIDGKLAGFVLSVPAYLRGERAYYSHMTAVSNEFQGLGIGAKLKWAQRERALTEGVKYIKWTFEPAKARNAHFNLEKLGAVVREFQSNFYGTDYSTQGSKGENIGLASDRLFAEWRLESEKVCSLAAGGAYIEPRTIKREILIPANWRELVRTDPETAVAEQVRIKYEFEAAFAVEMVCRGFRRDAAAPKYLLFED